MRGGRDNKSDYFYFVFIATMKFEEYPTLSVEIKREFLVSVCQDVMPSGDYAFLAELSEDGLDVIWEIISTPGNEERKRIWDRVEREYNHTKKELEAIVQKARLIYLQYRQKIAQDEDADDLKAIEQSLEDLE